MKATVYVSRSAGRPRTIGRVEVVLPPPAGAVKVALDDGSHALLTWCEWGSLSAPGFLVRDEDAEPVTPWFALRMFVRGLALDCMRAGRPRAHEELRSVASGIGARRLVAALGSVEAMIRIEARASRAESRRRVELAAYRCAAEALEEVIAVWPWAEGVPRSRYGRLGDARVNDVLPVAAE